MIRTRVLRDWVLMRLVIGEKSRPPSAWLLLPVILLTVSVRRRRSVALTLSPPSLLRAELRMFTNICECDFDGLSRSEIAWNAPSAKRDALAAEGRRYAQFVVSLSAAGASCELCELQRASSDDQNESVA